MWVIITESGKPLTEHETGALVLVPSVREAENWLTRTDRGVERFDPDRHGDRGN